jgi:hypothetical protein
MKLLSTTILAACALAFAANAEESTSAPLTTPAMTGPLKANAQPVSFDAGPIGKIYAGGAISGLAFAQSNATAVNDDTHLDLGSVEKFI